MVHSKKTLTELPKRVLRVHMKTLAASAGEKLAFWVKQQSLVSLFGMNQLKKFSSLRVYQKHIFSVLKSQYFKP